MSDNTNEINKKLAEVVGTLNSSFNSMNNETIECTSKKLAETLDRIERTFSNPTANVGANIEMYRKMKKMTAEDLANKIGITKKTIRRYELGELQLKQARIMQIAEALDVPIMLLTRTKEEVKYMYGADISEVLEGVVTPCNDELKDATFTNVLSYIDVKKEKTEKGFNMTIEHTGQSAELTKKEYDKFVDDILAYVDFNLQRMMSKKM